MKLKKGTHTVYLDGETVDQVRDIRRMLPDKISKSALVRNAIADYYLKLRRKQREQE